MVKSEPARAIAEYHRAIRRSIHSMLDKSTSSMKNAKRAAGLRERAKSDKRRRIMAAAREVFIERGYDAATTREIAQRADVSAGTVFLYAKDKRDLLLLIVNDELDAVSAKGAVLLAKSGPLLDRLLDFFRLRYRYWASEPRLARPALRETADFLGAGDAEGEQARRFYSREPLVLEQIGRAVAEAQAAGELRRDAPADQIASLLFSLYLIEARRWLAGDTPKVAAGMRRLESVLALFLRGVLTPVRAAADMPPRA